MPVDLTTPRRVVVKFLDTVILPYEDGAEKHVVRLAIGPWAELAQRYKGIRLDRLFKVLSPERISDLVSEALDRDRHYRAPNLLTFFVVDCPPGVDPVALARGLGEWTQVESAYVDPLDESPALLDNPDYRNGLQTYLKPPATAPPPSPQGAIDAEFAWAQPGGTGLLQKFVDLERGARRSHEDLATRGIPLLHGTSPSADQPHGASVLGVVAAVDNLKGGVGIAYGLAAVGYTSQVMASGVDRPDAVMAAIQYFTQPGESPFGRVLLLEVQLNPTNDPSALTDVHGVVWNHMPMETAPADFEVIRLASALGIVVVEATGNGVNNLDLFQEAGTGKFVLSRAHPLDFKDSGAIMVGGSTPDYPYRRSAVGSEGTGFGTRVDCFAWAGKVRTCDVDDFGGDDYRSDFDGTSAASAIVAGAALLVQGAAEATLGHRLSPGQLRALLSDPNLNTHSANYGVDLIGVMPNLKRILQDGLGVAPDVYIRDNVGDNGEEHTGAISLSPDIIVRPAPEPNPGVTFGPGTEGNTMLGPTATAGQDNFVYVRVWNRGAVDAAGVTATVFFAPPSTLPMGDAWTRIGSVAIANVPQGNVMTVSGAIVWPQASVPPAGHYCFVGLVGNAQDPAPDRATFSTFDHFYAYIRANNNVTWRNIDVVAVDGGDIQGLDFIAPGAPDSDRSFALAVGSRLPPGSSAWLEVPLALLGEHRVLVEVDPGGQRGRVPVAPRGRTTLPSAVFPAKSRAACRLLLRVPPAYRDGDQEVYVSQLYEGFEVGRVTWRIRLASPSARRAAG